MRTSARGSAPTHGAGDGPSVKRSHDDDGQQQQRGGAGAEGVLHERINTLQSDHTELKASIDRQFTSVHSAIQSIASEIKDRGKIQWPALAVMLGFVTSVGGLVYYPVKDALNKVEHSVETMAEKTVTEKELTAVLGAIKERRDDQMRSAEARFARLEGDVDRLQAGIVPRGEHEAHWAEQRERDATMQREIEAARTTGRR